MADPSRRPQILFLLGKRPRASTLFPDLFSRLATAGLGHRLVLPHAAPDQLTLAELEPRAAQVDLVVHRGLDDSALRLVDDLVADGVDCVNAPTAQRRVGVHDAVRPLLVDAGVRVPCHVVAPTWDAVLATARAAPGEVVVKRSLRGQGRGVEVRRGTASELPQARPFEGPFVVEEFVPNDGVDRKLYLVGDQVRGLLKPSPLGAGHTTEGEPFTPDTVTTEVARRAARACELPLCGVDVLPGPDGPVVIDINPFPGYRGVEDAPALIADYLRVRVHQGLEQSAGSRG